MDFILNSKTKKVEIFYENAAEQQAILNFMSQYLTYREDKTTPNIYINDPGISWTNAVATLTEVPNLSETITFTLNNSDSSNSDSSISVPKSNSIIIDSITAATKLDNTSDEDGYSCLTASVPHKTK